MTSTNSYVKTGPNTPYSSLHYVGSCEASSMVIGILCIYIDLAAVAREDSPDVSST